MEDSSSSEEDDIPEPENKNLSRDYNVSMAHYRKLRVDEIAKAVKPGWFGGLDNKEAEDSRRSQVGPSKRKYSKKRTETMIARQLQALPTFTPYFIYTITFIQVSGFPSAITLHILVCAFDLLFRICIFEACICSFRSRLRYGNMLRIQLPHFVQRVLVFLLFFHSF